MANRGKRGSSSTSVSASSASSPSSAATAAAATAGAHALPASVWGKGGFNPLTSPASHATTANGLATVDKSKERAATSTSSSSSSSSAPSTAAASATTAPSAASTAASSPASSTSASTPATAPAATATSSTSAATVTNTAAASTATPPTPTPASSLATICQLGNTVHVTTALGERLEGVVYVYDAAAHILALELTPATATPNSTARDYTLLHTYNLHVTLAHKPNTPPQRRTLPPIDHTKLHTREHKALALRAAEAAKINPTASPAGQRLFDALAKLYEARWEGGVIVLLGVLRLEEPYGSEQLTGGSVQQRQRIVKTIEAQREKEERK